MTLLRTSLLAAGLLAAMAGPAAAYNEINESFDGSWADTTQDPVGFERKGIQLDFIPGPNVLFFVMFSYNDAGEQVWFQNAIPVVPGVREYTAQAVALTGGTSSALGAPVETVLGSIDFSFQCDVVMADFTPAEGSGMSARSFNFSRPIDALGLQDCSAPVATCPAGTTADGEHCTLPNSITNDLFLPAGKTYIVEGQVAVEAGGTLTIAPGVTVQGSVNDASPNFIAVKRGGRIYAEGTPNQPITFTGPQAVPGSWAGLVLAGESDCNDAAGVAGGCQFEAVPEITYGGSNPEDSSGALRYVRILWAGQSIAPNEELNSLTLLAVGSGTVLENVQVDGGLDDGFEFFGGTVNGRYLVCSNMGDDCFDFDQGFSGKIQFALGWQGVNSDQGSDSNGIESDNDNPASDKLPRTRPQVSNITLVGNGNVGNEGARIRRGSGGNYANLVINGFRDRCLNLNDAQTFALGSAAAQGEALSMTHSFIGQCAGGAFEDDAADAYAVSAWFGAGAGNATGDAGLRANHYLPTAASPLLQGGQSLADGFFRPTTYRGAFSGPNDKWTAGWTVNIPN